MSLIINIGTVLKIITCQLLSIYISEAFWDNSYDRNFLRYTIIHVSICDRFYKLFCLYKTMHIALKIPTNETCILIK